MHKSKHVTLQMVYKQSELSHMAIHPTVRTVRSPFVDYFLIIYVALVKSLFTLYKALISCTLFKVGPAITMLHAVGRHVCCR